jgi:hypothetical protein
VDDLPERNSSPHHELAAALDELNVALVAVANELGRSAAKPRPAGAKERIVAALNLARSAVSEAEVSAFVIRSVPGENNAGSDLGGALNELAEQMEAIDMLADTEISADGAAKPATGSR